MFGLPIVLAAFALMGAPVLPTTCNPESMLAHQKAEGLTWFLPYTSTATRVEFGLATCAGLVYLAASPAERARLRELNPGYSFDRSAGLAFVVVLHEAHHAAGDRDEARTECFALKSVDEFAARYAPADELAAMLAFARAYDAQLPAAYHGASC